MKRLIRSCVLSLILPVLLLGTLNSPVRARTGIIGGQDAQPGEFPFLVALVNATDNSQFCGGSLIDKNWVLTAAHCFFTEDTPPQQDTFEADVKVIIGVTDLTDPSAQVVRVIKIFQPGYDGEIHDIALLKLDKSAVIDNKLVSIVKFNADATFPPLTTKAFLAGWGATDPEGNTPTDTLKKIAISITACASDVEGEYVCAGDKKGKDSCQGDSGGPLIVQPPDSAPDASKPQPGINAIQVGIVSFGGDRCFQLSAYTRTSFYKDWIAKTLRDNS